MKLNNIVVSKNRGFWISRRYTEHVSHVIVRYDDNEGPPFSCICIKNVILSAFERPGIQSLVKTWLTRTGI